MGGEHSGCDETTTDVLIESALWNPLNVARTGRELGIITDARYRFERGVDPEMMVPGLELATRLVMELCGGAPTETEVVGYAGHEPKIVSFPKAEVSRLTGLDVPGAESLSILTRLGFEPKGTGDVVDVAVPSWRPDVDGKADLVEEVMRIHGVEKIAPQAMTGHEAVNRKILTVLQNRTRAARRALAVRGMMEAVTWSFIPARHAELFGGGAPELKLSNPIAADMSDMRPSLLPGLVAAAQRNADRGFADVALFEVSGTYENDTPEGQRRVAAGVRRGTARMEGQGRHRPGNAASIGVFAAKAHALAALEGCGAPVDKLQVETGGPDWYHPPLGHDQVSGRKSCSAPSASSILLLEALTFWTALRLRNLCRRRPNPAKPTRTSRARPLALQAAPRLCLRRRPRGRGGTGDACGAGRRQEADHRRASSTSSRARHSARARNRSRSRWRSSRRAHADRRGLRPWPPGSSRMSASRPAGC